MPIIKNCRKLRITDFAKVLGTRIEVLSIRAGSASFWNWSDAVFWTRFWFSLNFNETLQGPGIGTVLPWVIELVVYIYYLGDRGVFFFLQVVLVGHSLGSISLLHAMENFTHKISLAIHVSGALLPSGVSFETTGDYFKGVSISPNSDSLTTYDPCQVL